MNEGHFMTALFFSINSEAEAIKLKLFYRKFNRIKLRN